MISDINSDTGDRYRYYLIDTTTQEKHQLINFQTQRLTTFYSVGSKENPLVWQSSYILMPFYSLSTALKWCKNNYYIVVCKTNGIDIAKIYYPEEVNSLLEKITVLF